MRRTGPPFPAIFVRFDNNPTKMHSERTHKVLCVCALAVVGFISCSTLAYMSGTISGKRQSQKAARSVLHGETVPPVSRPMPPPARRTKLPSPSCMFGGAASPIALRFALVPSFFGAGAISPCVCEHVKIFEYPAVDHVHIRVAWLAHSASQYNQ